MRGKVVADIRRCSGCRCCELICSLIHEGEFNPSLARIHVNMDPFEPTYYRPETCLQCEEPACMDICSADAIKIDEMTGAKIIQADKCVGCKLCMDACPFNVGQTIIRFHPENSACIKCDLCGGEPKCVQVCPWGALTYNKGEGDVKLG